MHALPHSPQTRPLQSGASSGVQGSEKLLQDPQELSNSFNREVADQHERSSAGERIPEGGLAGLKRRSRDEACLVAVGLSKKYLGAQALSDVSFQLHAGEIFGLVGPNGAGKTTLLRVLATLTTPDGGEFTLNGVHSSQVRAIRRQIGFTNDVLGVYDDMLAGEYLEFFARASGVESRLVEFAVDEVLEQVDLLRMREQPVDGLSRGMKQRLAFARAIITKPKLLLLDEPASGLDPLARLELKELLLRLAHQGTMVIISSHVLEDLAEVSHRIGVLRQGLLLKVARTSDLVADEGSRRFRIRGSDRAENLYQHLKGRRDVAGLRWDREELVFRWIDPLQSEQRPNQQNPAQLLGELVREGFLIESFIEEKASLENAYLHLAEAQKEY